MTSKQTPKKTKTNTQGLQSLFETLVKNIKTYQPKMNKARLERAFLLAKKLHEGQKRDSGEPYITHPLEVALILTEYSADEDMIIASLLHDSLEDCHFSLENLENAFGETVTHLVKGMTNIDKALKEKEKTNEKLEDHFKKDIETIRSIFTHAEQDIRVVLIKLADRLHNMRTLATKADEEKRLKKARETLAIYVRVAARLGIWKIKRELESLTFPYVYPEDAKIINVFLKKIQPERMELLQRIQGEVILSDEEHAISQISPYQHGELRLKATLDDKGQLSISDTLSLEIITKKESQCYLVLGLLHKLYQVHGVDDDFLNCPTESGYRAYHTDIVTPGGYTIECKITTEDYANRNWLGITGEMFEKKEHTEAQFLIPFEMINKGTLGNSERFLEAAKTDLLQGKIQIHTKGKSVYVPPNATVLDFAFYAFSSKAKYTKRIYKNDHEVNFSEPVEAGDVIHMTFSRSPKAEFQWFHCLNTALAHMKLKDSLKNWEYKKKVQVGHALLQKEFHLYEKGRVNSYFKKHWGRVAKIFSYDTVEELYAAIGEGNLLTYEVVHSLFPKTKDTLLQKLLHTWDMFLHNKQDVTGKEHVRVKIQGVLEKSTNPLIEIDEVRKQLGIVVPHSTLCEDQESQIFTLKLNCVAPSKKSLHKFIARLEQKDGIIQVSPLLSYKKIGNFTLWLFATLALWLVFPVLIAMKHIEIEQLSQVLQSLIIYASLFPLLICNYFLFSLSRHVFPQIKDVPSLIISTFVLNIFGITLFTWQLTSHQLAGHLGIVIPLFVFSNILYIYQLYSTHSEYTFEKISITS